jgi:predicted RNA-binding Zn-ribbon protein involved in translation (DUF1610 family)
MYAVRQQTKRYPCPVCGYGLEHPAQDFNICPSCGVEFGYDTAGRSLSVLRAEWVATGACWTSRVDLKPKDWNPWLQLISAGFIYAVPFRADVKPDQSWNEKILISSEAVGNFAYTT